MKKCYYLFALFLMSACGSHYPAMYEANPETVKFQGDVYDIVSENRYKNPSEEPLSTFAIDVDGASYSNIRRMITDGTLPPPEAIRIEEMINYFNYDYPAPTNGVPFAVTTEVAPAPWNPDHQLVHIGLKGREFESDELPPNNLVFLIDVSGSMRDDDKLPLLKKGFRLLVDQLREDDYVSIVTYSGRTAIALPPTPGNEKKRILLALESLEAGGATAGGKAIKKAYKLARKQYNSFANNRVILATDGDFNFGVSRDDELIDLIETERESGINISVIGFGSGNLRDSKMEKIADHGNGNYYYIDNMLEAKKVLVSEINGTLHTIAKDVKIQVEFNPANVQAYRLIGYENRMLISRDFNDDRKDAGELGAGHTITALYEIVPAGTHMMAGIFDTDPLRYQYRKPNRTVLEDEIMTLKLRYKSPENTYSDFISSVLTSQDVSSTGSQNLTFAASVTCFGMLLRDSQYMGEANYELVKQLAASSSGSDSFGYRAEFMKLVEHAELLDR